MKLTLFFVAVAVAVGLAAAYPAEPELAEEAARISNINKEQGVNGGVEPPSDLEEDAYAHRGGYYGGGRRPYHHGGGYHRRRPYYG